MTRPDPVEVIARARGKVIDAICGVEDHGRPLEDIFPANVLGAVADAAIAAFNAALKDAGYAVVEVEKADDSARLDWLDTVNIRMNERNGSVYGWQYDINHNRACLADNNLPALTVREAIDAARFPEQKTDIILRSHREQKRLADFRAAHHRRGE